MRVEHSNDAPLRVLWATDYEADGNAYGYSMHTARARDAVEKAGVQLDPSAPVAVHVAPAHLFRPIPGRRNILYMAWETEDLPEAHLKGVAAADAVAVTASFLVDVIRRRFPEKPVARCPLGVDADTFSFRHRRKPLDRPFRFLWVGAPNARKGWELVLSAWKPFEDDGRAELYLKTTVTNRFERHRNILFDSRNLPLDELVSLYHSAHAFLFPSFGEGFGLTLAEAMATGLPALFTPWSSLPDFADASCAYPLKYQLIPAWATPEGGLSTDGPAPSKRSVRTRLAQAEPSNLARRMVEVFRHYPRAARRGARAAQRIRSRFTWARAAHAPIQLIKEVNNR